LSRLNVGAEVPTPRRKRRAGMKASATLRS
jgi:hypothetical protein